MKNTHIIFTIFLATLFVTSCSTSYNDIDPDHSAVIGFTSPDLEISVSESNPEKNRPLPYFVSDVSSSDRTFHIIIIEEETELFEESYLFESTIVIPANERSGQIILTARNNATLTNEYAPLVLAIEESPGVVSGNRVLILIKTTD